jgi:Flp pilus assembly protein protease CpaA
MEILEPPIIFFSIILIIGVLTTSTDLKHKKIYNQHLIIGAALGLIATAYTAIFRHEDIFLHIVNGLTAFLIGFIMHRFALWRGGDAKLFTLYALLMPTPLYGHPLCPDAIILFASSFIAGMLILLPILIKDMVTNHNAIINDLLSLAKRRALFTGIWEVLYYSWVLFPFYYLLKTTKMTYSFHHLEKITNPIVILTIISLFFSREYKNKKKADKNSFIKFLNENFIPLIIGIVFGFLMRLWLNPNSLSYPALTRYIIIVILSSLISICIHITINHFKDYQDRVPFAPLLFIGCILSYTPFLSKLMYVTIKWNTLLSQ